MPTATVQSTQVFPSVEWFKAVADAMPLDLFRKLGSIDTTFAIRVRGEDGIADPKFILTFGAYTLDDVREVSSTEGVDFVLEAPYAAWKEMVQNIRENDGADLHHTLNYLHFGVIELACEDQLKADQFFRVNSSLQAFFDASAAIESRFER